MAGLITDIKGGLKTILETIVGLRVYDQAPDSINEFPAAVILPGSTIDYQVVIGGNAIRGQLIVILITASGDKQGEGWATLDNYLAPTGAKSIKGAIGSDRTLNGKVDDAWLIQASSIGVRNEFGGSYLAANFTVGYIAT